MNTGPAHVPVMLHETMEMLAVKENGTYLDATVGLGGHSERILSGLGPSGRLIGLDRDDEALRLAGERLGNGRVTLRQGSFSRVAETLDSLAAGGLDGALFDLGVSMLQLRDMDRGFSFMSSARLDMRMDKSQTNSAWDVVNRYQERDLARILYEYGEERKSRRIAGGIVAARKKAPIDTCAQLADLVAGLLGGRRGKIHPATRTFQALRLEVNRELEELQAGMTGAFESLRAGGRLCVISYHSLEDRIVKHFMKGGAADGRMRLLSKKPLVPGAEEMRANPSARSAKLRGAEKI